MSVEDCARLVERGDQDRFLATMAAPPAARDRLFPLYAFNLEVARAPQVASEPMIGEIRLTWWREALDEIADGRPVRSHEVTVPLALALTPDLARGLDDLVAARMADLDAEPFADAEALTGYLDRTAGTLLWTAAAMLGAGDEAAVRALGRAQGLANWFLAVPAMMAQGRRPLPDGSDAGVRALARAALAALRPTARNPALLAAWRARALLRQALRDPARVADGRLGQSEFVRRGSLLLRALR